MATQKILPVLLSRISRIIGKVLGFVFGVTCTITSPIIFLFLIPPDSAIAQITHIQNTAYEFHWAYFVMVIFFGGPYMLVFGGFGIYLVSQSIKGAKQIKKS